MSAQFSRLPRIRREQGIGHAWRKRAVWTVLFFCALGGPAFSDAVPAESIAQAPAFDWLPVAAALVALAVGLGGGFAVATLRARKAAEAPERPPLSVPNLPSDPSPSLLQDNVPPLATLNGRTAKRWLDHLAHGPRFGPRVVGLVAAPDCNRADAISRIAAVARGADRDVVVVEAGDVLDDLAAALDRHFSRTERGADPFGALPKVEIVPMRDLLPQRHMSQPAAWRDAFDRLGARADILLVDLPADGWTRLSALLETLDEIVLLREAGSDAGQIAALCETARERGTAIDAQIVLADAA